MSIRPSTTKNPVILILSAAEGEGPLYLLLPFLFSIPAGNLLLLLLFARATKNLVILERSEGPLYWLLPLFLPLLCTIVGALHSPHSQRAKGPLYTSEGRSPS
jgi:hypothetical protein